MTMAKTLIPNKEWLITKNKTKLGSISKNKKGYKFFKKNLIVPFKTLEEVKVELGITNFDDVPNLKNNSSNDLIIYDYPCSNKPFDPVYNLKQKLPLFSKSAKSKSQYCAGYYIIKFRKGWVKSFCPKLITLERYPYHGPFKTEREMKDMLNSINKHESS